MRKILVVIDMQNDFIDGSLGTKEAVEILPRVIKKIKEYKRQDVFATRDTHGEDYLKTLEGKHLPVPHCVKDTYGWQLQSDIGELIDEKNIFNKESFGSLDLSQHLLRLSESEELKIELVGLCTDICVISNAILIKNTLVNTDVTVDSSCSAGVTPESHKTALASLKTLQVIVE